MTPSRRSTCLLLVLAIAGVVPRGAGARAAESMATKTTPILASYDFEQVTPSGPDTFWLREGRGGRVDLSAAFRISGARSLHLREVEGNRDFAEFLGYFDERTEGSVFVQFYILLTDPGQRFNFGLAGNGWFLNPKQHGHAIWLGTEGGDFGHRPGQRWRRLFTPQPFVWYFIDLVYRVDQGRYDLAIYEEGCGTDCEKPVVDVRDQRNFADADDSSVRYFSFIGDLEDEGRFDYFVDDVLVATDPVVRHRPFVAPGRRAFFVDRWRMRACGSAHDDSVADDADVSVADDTVADDTVADDLLVAARQWLRSVEVDAIGDEPLTANQLEAAADEAFARGDLDVADALYLRLAEPGIFEDGHGRSVRVRLKRADVAFRRGDLETERGLREAIYGRLELEEHR